MQSSAATAPRQVLPEPGLASGAAAGGRSLGGTIGLSASGFATSTCCPSFALLLTLAARMLARKLSLAAARANCRRHGTATNR